MAASPTTDDEITRLRTMAAQLRSEAANLEAEQRTASAAAAQRAFDKFDQNHDGEISVEELKAGLERTFKMDLEEARVQQLMQAFDQSGDGVLQPDEMVNIEQFRNKLEALVRDEKAQAREQAKRAQQEKAALAQMESALEMINEGEPTTQDKIVSVLPYLFPLLDGLQFAGPLVLQHPDNVLAQVAGVAYALYRSIPLGGFLAFFALSTLSGNPRLNRLIRFNMNQAIFLDIALFVPALLVALGNGAASLAGAGGLPPVVNEVTSNGLLVAMLTSVAYSTVSSLLGQTPDKIPFVSDRVQSRMPNFDMMRMDFQNFKQENEKKNNKGNDENDKEQ